MSMRFLGCVLLAFFCACHAAASGGNEPAATATATAEGKNHPGTGPAAPIGPHDPTPPSETARPGTPSTTQAPGGKPNIVFILTDDLSMNLVQYMPNLQAMQKEGVTFSNYFVSNSFCCPSRSTIFTGKFPHNTGVLTNTGPQGGYKAFNDQKNTGMTFAVALQQAGYKTAMLGKYLNGYHPGNPPQEGWNEWDVAGRGYRNFNYDLNQNGTVKKYGKEAADYLTDVIGGLGQEFIKKTMPTGPFFIEFATFSPHRPYVPAPRDDDKLRDVKAPRTASFGARPTPTSPVWLQRVTALDDSSLKDIEKGFRKRAESVLSVDRLIGEVRALLAHEPNTYVFFSSDNGYHMGEYSLRPGKQTPYDIDVRVPLVVVGPGLPSGKVVDAIVQNTDFCPTFDELGGVTGGPAAPDGRSIVQLLRGETPGDWRKVAFVEHFRREPDSNDPDVQVPNESDPSTYVAIRSKEYLYVEYEEGNANEFHDLTRDPEEITNTAAGLPAERRTKLHAALEAIKTCKGAEACKAAMAVAP